MPKRTATAPTGIWLIGARGGLATTVIVGATLLRRGLVSTEGLVTALPEFAGLPLDRFGDMVFGGHEIRTTSLMESAREIAQSNGSLDQRLLAKIAPDLRRVDRDIRPGSARNCGRAIERLTSKSDGGAPMSARAIVARLTADLLAFRRSHGLGRLVVINLASTEPPAANGESLGDLRALNRALDARSSPALRASTLYACAAIEAGAAYINFTPSGAALPPAVRQLAMERGLPFMGSDGKTGETLVKTALAPMFRYRNLRVLSWQGYNILGDRDGLVLSDPENLASKVRTKDSVVPGILGYPLHTHVGIDFVPSLGDQKTAWDFIHFAGFLGHRMTMQFTWQGCDAILAAPLVLDLARFASLALRRGDLGAMTHLACFFKQPIGCMEHNLHSQFDELRAFSAEVSAEYATPPRRGRKPPC